ncbi:MAG: methyltransferase domain-containing protein [Alphaproteobacteria bacterium]|nr:methyltransferase domain-containing protein [Alphaproteobacteria bacterium]
MAYVVYSIGWLAIIFNIYWIVSFVKSGFGKYPPCIISFGFAKKKVLEQAKKYIRVNSGMQTIVDLGCGCGDLLLPLAKEFPQHRFVGIERDIIVYFLVKLRSLKYKNIKIIWGDFLNKDWTQFDVFVCYLGNEIAPFVAKKFLIEAKEKAVLVSEVFAMPNLYEVEKFDIKTCKLPTNVFVYKKIK